MLQNLAPRFSILRPIMPSSNAAPARVAWFELLSVTGLVLSYIWLWQGAFNGDLLVCLGLVVGITLAGHRRRGESPRDLGFRLDNVGQSTREVFSIVGPLLVVLIAVGLVMGWNREPPIDRLLARVVLMPLSGVVQEYALLGFYYRRFSEVLTGEAFPVLASATLFALLHLPNTPLMLLTSGFSAWLTDCCRSSSPCFSPSS
jgi:membrane protease YdiL (CAAX protease family)